MEKKKVAFIKLYCLKQRIKQYISQGYTVNNNRIAQQKFYV